MLMPTRAVYWPGAVPALMVSVVIVLKNLCWVSV